MTVEAPIDPDDSLAELAKLQSYASRRGASAMSQTQRPTDEAGVRLAELKVETTYVRRDLDQLGSEMRDFRKELKEVRASQMESGVHLARLEEKVASLPSYEKMVATIAVLLALFSSIIIYGDKVRGLLGGTAQQTPPSSVSPSSSR